MSKSIFRRPGTRHFQLVHRSQRDPLINDPDASAHVLREVARGAPSATVVDDTDRLSELELAEGDDPAAYGILFDDKDYDYMQHLRSVGEHTDAFLVEAPSSKRKRGADESSLQLREPGVALPDDALPSHPLDELTYTQVTEGKAQEQGLRLDLDPEVREVLEALDDDAYADEAYDEDGERLSTNGEDDAFWGEILQGGATDSLVASNVAPERTDDEWAAIFAKARDHANSSDEDDLDNWSDELDDEVPNLAQFAGSRRRQRGDDVSSVGTMTSSALFRNEGLRLLDDRFDKVEQDYDDSGDDSDDEHATMEDHNADVKLVLAALKTDQDARPANEETELVARLVSRGQAQLAAIRQMAVAADTAEDARALRERILALDISDADEQPSQPPLPVFIDHGDRRVAWDCESVLSTYSNLSNHPRRLKALGGRQRVNRIRIDPKTGFPLAVASDEPRDRLAPKKVALSENEGSDGERSENEDQDPRDTIARPRGETIEEKRARKNAVKAERAARRIEKKSNKGSFADELKRQKNTANKQVVDGAHADVRGEGVRRIA